MTTSTHKVGPITHDEVKAAYDELAKLGESTTLKNIRARLGDRGSLETIKKFRAGIIRAAEEEERRKNPEIPGEDVRQVFLGQAEHLLLTSYAAGLRRGRDISREIQAGLVTLEVERDQLLADFEEGQRMIRERDDEIDRIKQAGENTLAGERQRVDDARLEAHAARMELTAYQARTGAKIETLEEALRLAKDELTRSKLHLAKAQGKIALLSRTGSHAIGAVP